MTKSKSRKCGKRTDPLHAGAFAAFGETGDVTGLGALADALDERGERPEFAALLRAVADRRDRAIRFFWLHAGCSWNPATETEEQGRLRGAVELADAERWLEENDGSVEWRIDDEYDPADCDGGDMHPNTPHPNRGTTMTPLSKCRYRLTHHSEEFACPTCGAPVYVGDTAWDDDGDCYCSAHCAGADPRGQWVTSFVVVVAWCGTVTRHGEYATRPEADAHAARVPGATVSVVRQPT
jgi:hypothetical protein